jgi:hypothetical protein
MNLFKRVEMLGSKMKWADFAIFKITMVAFTLFLVTAWPAFQEWVLSVPWYCFLIVGVLFAIPLWKKMF